MILSILATIVCSLSFTLSGIQNYTSSFFTQKSNEKSVVFEGDYINLPNSVALSEINDEASQEIKVYFFIEPSNSLETIRTNRPSISDEDLTDVQNDLKEYRERIQNNIHENNLHSYSKIRDLFAKDENVKIEISKVNSLITASMSPHKITEELITNLNKSLNANGSTIDEIYIGNEPQVESFSSLPTTFEKINVDNMINNGPYDGSGINVGIVESAAYDDTSGGVIDVSKYGTNLPGYDDYYGRSIKIRSGQTDLSYHADHVAMIAVGNNGIARDSNILSCYSQGGVESYAKWLVDENMNVANGSFGGVLDYGIYPSQSKLMDEWIKNYLFTFVAAAGNKTYDEDKNVINDNYVTWPATGFNVISVGNSYESSSIIEINDSCYKEMSNYYGSKPNIIAPGTTTTNSYNPIDKKYSGTGTSYAAPQVTGCIALLMEEFPYLVAYPELVTSIITSSASPMSSTYNNEYGDNHYDGSGLHNQIGAGLLNYEKMREAANQYLSITRPKNSSVGIIPQYIDIVATDGQRIRASSAWLYDEDTFTDYDLELYKLDVDGTMDKVTYIDDPYNNVEFIDFNVQTTGTYRLVVNQKEQNTANDFIGLSYVLIDDEGGSTSGATNIDDTLDSHFEIDRSIYEDYGDTYNNEAITETEINDGIHIYETTRKRARYTDDGKLVLSAKSNDSNSAYMEYKFDITDPINDDWGLYNIKYQFGLWSDDESLIRNSTIDLYGLHHGSWLLIRHFDPKEMSTDPNNLKTYIDCLDFPVNGLRFYVKTNYTNNNNNVGRVVIGNIEGDIHYHLYTKYEQYNDNYHKVVCGCGDYHLESHTWGPSYSSGIYEYANCTKCDEQHNMTSGGPIVTPIV